ncbi:hypothetical protein LCGC14_0725940 [marine sediment metagenome]|uniref:Uncharacterized protein n=1 Tax=marine sediment metagenome TaxID=412755 RepID=A0A0F9QF62_9ZZZZ
MRGPVEGGDKLKVSALDDSGPISYLLARVPNNVSYETVSEQPEAEPNQPVVTPLTFHGGLAYSIYDPRQAGAITNTSMLIDQPNIIRPPVAPTTVTLSTNLNPPAYYFETLVNDGGADEGQPVLYVIVPVTAEPSSVLLEKISLDSGDFGTLLNSKAFTVTHLPGDPICQPAEWNDGTDTFWRLGLGDNGKIQELQTIASGTSNDTWNASADADARHLKLVGNRLYRSTDENQISILPRASDPMAEANWGDDFFIGDVSKEVTAIGESGPFAMVAKEDGFYEFDGIGEATNVFPEIGRGDGTGLNNGQGMVFWHGGFMIPAASALWWTVTGEPVGPDSNPNNTANDPSLGSASYLRHGHWAGLAAFGKYIYGLYISSAGTDAYLLQGRERDSSDPPGWGPLIWTSIDLVTANFDNFRGIFISELSEFSSSETRPSLWYPHGNHVRYVWLDKDGAVASRRGDIDLATSGSVTSGRIDGGMPNVPKQLWAIEGWAEDFGSVSGSFQFNVYRDGGSSEAVGSTITSDGFFRQFWTQDSNDTGRTLLVNVTWTGSSSLTDTNGPHLRDVVVREVALPRVSREWMVLFMVEDEQAKTAKKIRSELEAYVGDMKKYTLPDRDTFNGVMGKPRMLRADEIDRLTPRNQEPPKYVISAPIKEMSGS